MTFLFLYVPRGEGGGVTYSFFFFFGGLPSNSGHIDVERDETKP